ncbi:MAG: hypothetical protein WAN35_18975 [Terracidiphilus sp.]
MIAAKIFSCAPLISLPGAVALIAEAILLLAVYATAVMWPQGRIAFVLRPQFATRFGAVAGLLQIIHLLVERFTSFPTPWDGRITLAFMLATFLLWGFAGYHAAGAGFSFLPACLSAIWSAMVTMTIAVFAGTLLEFLIAPIPVESMRAWAEFQRSGWNDLYAFSIANTIDEASNHLFIGPIVACIFGAIFFGFYRFFRKPNRLSQNLP